MIGTIFAILLVQNVQTQSLESLSDDKIVSFVSSESFVRVVGYEGSNTINVRFKVKSKDMNKRRRTVYLVILDRITLSMMYGWLYFYEK